MATQTDHKPWQKGRCLLTQDDFNAVYSRYTLGGIPAGHHNRLAALGARLAIRIVDQAVEEMRL